MIFQMVEFGIFLLNSFWSKMKTIALILSLILFPAFAGDPKINFAPGILPSSFKNLHPKLQDIAYYIAGYCAQNQIKFVITSTIRSKARNAAVLAKSMTHVEARAFDFSIRESHGWTDDKVMILVMKIEQIYKQYGAFSAGTGKQVIIFNHSTDVPGSYHSHVQVHRTLPWK